MQRVATAGILLWGLVIVLCLLASEAKGVDRRWNAQEGNWHEPNNWDPNTSAPTVNDTAIVNQGEAQVTSADAVAYELRIASEGSTTGTVSVSNGKILTVKDGGV